METSNILKILITSSLLFVFFALIVLAVVYYPLWNLRPGTLSDNDLEKINTDNQNSNVIAEKKLIVIVSLDGLGSNLIGLDTPFLVDKFNKENTSYTLNMQGLEGAETMPSHISMLSGLTQAHHGFYKNSVNSSTPVLNVQTVFDYALQTNYSYSIFVTKEKLLYLAKGQSGSNIEYSDALSSESLINVDKLVEPGSPNQFVFIHFKDIDSFGHLYGWGSFEQKQAIKVLDGNIRMLINDINEEYSSYQRYFIITSDHGGEARSHGEGCPLCSRIPLIVISENTNNKYELESRQYNIYDVTCITLDLLEIENEGNLDCK